jgi:hypothetical protein
MNEEIKLWAKIANNEEIQEALKRLNFVISSEIGKVEDLVAIVQFGDGAIEEIWVDLDKN